MKKQLLLKTIFGALAFSICAPLLAYFSFAYKPNKGTIDGKTWMSNVDDNKRLDELSIPGSHDSGSLYSIGDLMGKCQDLSISSQLNVGTRMFDLRLQQVNDEMAICHGIINEDLSFKSVLSDSIDFLTKNPSETLIFSIKKENDTKSSKLTFEECLFNELNEFDSKYYYTNYDIPTLGELRGKIYFISRYSNSSIGINAYDEWQEPSETDCTFDMSLRGNVHVQDYYKFNDENIKISQIKQCLEYSSSTHNLTMNFFSGYYSNGIPPMYAGGVAKVVNKWATEHLSEYSCTGIALFDYIGEDLAKLVWEKNL